MGRCYDFGVSIDTSSERAMVVAAEGGVCVCPSSGVTCTGRFAGCADILNQPGRIPSNAPAWSLDASPEPVVVLPNTPPMSVVPPQPVVLAPEIAPAIAPHLAAPAAPPAPAAPMAPPAPAMPQPNAVPQTNPVPQAHAAPHAQAAPTQLPATPPTVATPTAPVAPPAPSPVAPEPAASPSATDAAVAELLSAVRELKSEVAEVRQRPPEVSVEDIAEAILALRTTPSTEPEMPEPTPEPERVDDSNQAIEQLRTEVLARQDELAGSLHRLGRAMIELRDAQTATAQQADMSGPLGALELGHAQLTQSVEELRVQMTGATDAQAREVHALRAQVTAMMTRLEERRAADVSGAAVMEQLEALRSEVTRRDQDGADMSTATDLAATINTLRESGVEEISAAHLVHSFQLELRSLRTELHQIRDAVSTGTRTDVHA